MSVAKKSGSNGETELQSVIEAADNTQLYLIRVPKHIKCAELDGVKIKKFSDKCTVDTLDFPMGHYVFDADSGVDYSAFRALVKNSGGAVHVGDAFAGSLTMRRVFDTPSIATSSPAVCIIILCTLVLLGLVVNVFALQTKAYAFKAQSTDLALPRLPVGSLSTPEELRARLGIVEETVNGKDEKKKQKKRKRTESDSNVETLVTTVKKEKKKSSKK